MTSYSQRIAQRLERSRPAALNAYLLTLAFITYFCMYAFRKPFAAARFAGLYFAGTQIELKTALVISQIVGYALSKFVGIRICSEVQRRRQAPLLVALIAAAELALVLFAVLPQSWKVAAIFLNGLPLGMVWGLVVRYLEGRRTSEILLAGLSCSFIVSSGVVKDVGRALLTGDRLFGVPGLALPWAVPEFWMPAVTGLLFFPPLLAAVWLLDLTPEPSALDRAARMQRVPMGRARRAEFLRRFGPGIAMLVAAYFFLTAFRDYRDNYLVDMLDELGYGGGQYNGAITIMESLIAIGIMAAMATLSFVQDNRRGLFAVFAVMIAGVAMLGAATWLWHAGLIGGLMWIALLGMASYLTYVPFNSLLFDRLIASTRVAGTAVFAIYVADALGYTGSVGVLLFKDLAAGGASRSEFLGRFALLMSGFGIVALSASCGYFLSWSRQPAADPASAPDEAGVPAAGSGTVATATTST
jgi:hypothetical protein